MLKIGLIGCGYLGSRHLNHLSTLEGVEVSSVWDNDPSMGEKAAKEFGVPIASNLNDLLTKSDAVDIVTPTSTHYEIGLEVINAGLPIFVEKPICATLEEGELLVRKAQEADVILQVGHIERFNRAFRALKNIRIQPRFIEAHRLAFWNPRAGDVAVVHDLMIHDLDLILTLANDFPAQINASGVAVVSNKIDIANVRLEFPSGLVANITASRISLKSMRKLRMFGNQEYIAIDMNKGTCEFLGMGKELPTEAEALGNIGLDDEQRVLFQRLLVAEEGDALRMELEAFRDAIVSDSHPPISGEDGLKALKLAEMIVAEIEVNLEKASFTQSHSF